MWDFKNFPLILRYFQNWYQTNCWFRWFERVRLALWDINCVNLDNECIKINSIYSSYNKMWHRKFFWKWFKIDGKYFKNLGAKYLNAEGNVTIFKNFATSKIMAFALLTQLLFLTNNNDVNKHQNRKQN